MFNLFKKKPLSSLVAPVDGELIKIEDVSDEVFSTKVMGDGFAIVPSSDSIVSPVNGEITSVFPTKHAISITDEKGLEILLHLGIDTVELEGKPFEILVSQGQKVSTGEILVRMDRDAISNNGKKDTVILVLPRKENAAFDPVISEKKVKSGEPLVSIKRLRN